MNMYKALASEIFEIYDFYKEIVDYMNTKGLRLGWDIEKYPNLDFIKEMVSTNAMHIVRNDNKIICCAAINHIVNPEYNDIDWKVKSPNDRISTIHALAVAPEYRSQNISDEFLREIENYCKHNGDLAIHFDVIDFNTPALNLYLRNGYNNLGAIEMYYEVVGTKSFYMLEKVF